MKNRSILIGMAGLIVALFIMNCAQVSKHVIDSIEFTLTDCSIRDTYQLPGEAITPDNDDEFLVLVTFRLDQGARTLKNVSSILGEDMACLYDDANKKHSLISLIMSSKKNDKKDKIGTMFSVPGGVKFKTSLGNTVELEREMADIREIEMIFSVDKNVKLKHLSIGNNIFEISGQKTVKL